ncbi:DUF937 domain-containing protein [Euzebya tangerina]|uniref:DUF937 domain-containing protein n=1 Tax=Euzebya tangerina TaxID=591198 RepID=UPI000E320AB1|nr:DUF937 domain-containing protein [Euzebya tangerina]
MATPSEEILSNVSISRLAQRLGTDEATAREAAEAALPTLLAGMTRQARDPQQRQGLATAVQRDHDPAVLEHDDPLDRVDAADGQKILGHVFGDDRGRVENELQGFLGGSGGGLMSKVLPMLAPLVMSYLAGKMFEGGGGQPRPAEGGGGGLGDILGSVLGGGPSGGDGRPGGSTGGRNAEIGDILGDVFGGSRSREESSSGGGGGLGDILGQLGGKAGGGGGLDDLLGSILGGRR